MDSNQPTESETPDDEHEAVAPLGAGIDFTDPNSPLAPYYLRTADVVGILLICLSVTFFGSLRLWHSDIWGHVLFGEWILKNQALPDHEPFTPYSDSSQRPVHAQWLTQVIYGSLAQFGEVVIRESDPEKRLARSAEFLRLFHVILLAAQFVLLWLAFRRIGGSTAWANLALVLLWFQMLAPLSVQRPQALGLFCFSLQLYVLSRPEFSRKAIFGLPVMYALWANLHGTFIVGLAFFFLFVVGHAVRLWSTFSWKQIFSDLNLRRLALAFVLSAAAGCLNPHGPMIYVEVLTFANRPNIDLIDEWQPLEVGSGPFIRYALLTSMILFAWAASGFSGAVLLLIALPFAIWPFKQQRQMVWWSLLMPWLLAYFGPLISSRIRLFREYSGSAPSFRKTLLAGSVVLLTMIWVGAAQSMVKARVRPLQRVVSDGTAWRLGFEFQATPEQRGRWLPAFAEAIRNYPDGRYQGSIFSSEVLGDYLIRVAPPGSPVLTYSHAHFFPRDHWISCINVKFAQGDWRAFLATNRVNLIVIQPDYFQTLAEELRHDPAWQIILDEQAERARWPGDRLLIALRKQPL